MTNSSASAAKARKRPRTEAIVTARPSSDCAAVRPSATTIAGLVLRCRPLGVLDSGLTYYPWHQKPYEDDMGMVGRRGKR